MEALWKIPYHPKRKDPPPPPPTANPKSSSYANFMKFANGPAIMNLGSPQKSSEKRWENLGREENRSSGRFT